MAEPGYAFGAMWCEVDGDLPLVIPVRGVALKQEHVLVFGNAQVTHGQCDLTGRVTLRGSDNSVICERRLPPARLVPGKEVTITVQLSDSMKGQA